MVSTEHWCFTHDELYLLLRLLEEHTALMRTFLPYEEVSYYTDISQRLIRILDIMEEDFE